MILEEGLYLQHYGKKGMHWGVRSSPEKRALNKASRQRVRQQHATDVEAARERFRSGQNKETLKKAKTQFHKDSERIGKAEARVILNKKKVKLNEDFYKAQQYKNGKETAVAVLAVAGTIAAAQIIGRVLAGR